MLDTDLRNSPSVSKRLPPTPFMLLTDAPGATAIKRALTFIHDHSAGDISLAAVARVVNLSPTYFCRRFKECTGMPFVEYVARFRITTAQDLLRNPTIRISEMAFIAGFQSISQFNRIFRRYVGMSPSDSRAMSFRAGTARNAHQS